MPQGVSFDDVYKVLWIGRLYTPVCHLMTCTRCYGLGYTYICPRVCHLMSAMGWALCPRMCHLMTCTRCYRLGSMLQGVLFDDVGACAP